MHHPTSMNDPVFMNETQQYILTTAECLLIELAHDHLLDHIDRDEKISVILQLIQSREQAEYLIEKFQYRQEENFEHKPYAEILAKLQS